MVIYRFNSFHCLTRSSSRHHLPSTRNHLGSFALEEAGHLRSRIICGPFWESFAVWGSFAVGDHLRYRTVLESSSSWLGIVCLSIKLSWSRAEVTGEFVTYTVLSEGRFLLSGHLPEATAESSHFKWSPCGWFDCMLCLCWLIFAPLQPEVQFTVLNSAPTTGGSTSIC